jgi:hypothetical protein
MDSAEHAALTILLCSAAAVGADTAGAPATHAIGELGAGGVPPTRQLSTPVAKW